MFTVLYLTLVNAAYFYYNLTLLALASETTDFYWEGEIPPPPTDSLLAKPRMDKNLCHFIHIRCEQFVGQRKTEHQFWSKIVAVAAKYKNSAKDINLLKSAYTAEIENFSPFAPKWLQLG